MAADGGARGAPDMARAVALFQARVAAELEALIPEAAYLETIGRVGAGTDASEVLRILAEVRGSAALDQSATLVELVLAQPDLAPALCQALRGSSGDPFDVARRITPALLALAIAGQSIAIPPEPLLFAAIALAIARQGVEHFCVSVPGMALPARPGRDSARAESRQLLNDLLGAQVAPAPPPRQRRARPRSTRAPLLVALLLVALLGGGLLLARRAMVPPAAQPVGATTVAPTQPAPAPTEPVPALAQASPLPTPIDPSPTSLPSPTPRAAPTAAPTAAPSATPDPCVPARIAGTGPSGLNIRESPALDARVLVALLEGTELLGCETRTVGELRWMRVQATVDGQSIAGWANADYIEPRDALP